MKISNFIIKNGISKREASSGSLPPAALHLSDGRWSFFICCSCLPSQLQFTILQSASLTVLLLYDHTCCQLFFNSSLILSVCILFSMLLYRNRWLKTQGLPNFLQKTIFIILISKLGSFSIKLFYSY